MSKERVRHWVEEVGMFTDGILEKQMQKIAEEVVECSIEVAKDQITLSNLNNVKSEFGDILFSAYVGCMMSGLDPDECLRAACDKNDKRIGFGRMVNGSFVKAEDLTK